MKSFWRDPQFYLALSLAPFFWIGLWMGSPPAFVPFWPLVAPLIFLKLALLYPILEELVFRGLLQEWLLKKEYGKRQWAGVSVANIIVCAAFALSHLINQPPLWALSVFFPGLVFGYFRDRHRSVVPAIVLHVFYNIGYFWLFKSDLSALI